MIEKEDIMEYSFYNDDHELVVILDEKCLKKLFGADIIALEETGHK